MFRRGSKGQWTLQSSLRTCLSIDMIKCFSHPSMSSRIEAIRIQAARKLAMPTEKKERSLRRWRQLVDQLMKALAAMVHWVNTTKVVRELKYRSPALMAYMEAILQKETIQAQDLPPALPPASTRAKGQTPLPLAMAYEMEPKNCPHLVEHGRRYGNAHGKFLECITCGSVWKGLDYQVPITAETVTTYKVYVGIRDRPGGKVIKGATARKVSSTKSSAYSSSSYPTSMEAAYGTTPAPTPSTTSRNKADKKPVVKKKAETFSLDSEDDMSVMEIHSTSSLTSRKSFDG